MDLFKFNPTSSDEATDLVDGERINQLNRVTWIERYNAPGEFSLEAQLSTGLKDFLPLGTLISHVDTLEVMIVENHEIPETIDADATITVTGRSLWSFLENRVTGINNAKSDNVLTPYFVPNDNTWSQIVAIINDHINNVSYPDDELPNVVAGTLVTGTGENVSRVIQFGTLMERIQELLKIDDLGIRVIRKNAFTIGSSTETLIWVHNGLDKSDRVRFSWKSRDLTAADYLFSQKNLKNCAFVIGQYVYVEVPLGPVKYNKRVMVVDGKDIDGHLGEAPTGTALTDIVNAMTVLGRQALAKQNNVVLSQADVSDTTNYKYRRDYDIGDLIALDGNFGQSAIMRVVEYAEIEDENGASGHPTLSLPGGETFASFTI